jgi:transcriptional regulator with XRE-family HTH domain
MNLGERIAQARKSKGVTQTFIARKMGKTPQWLSGIEAGRRNIDAIELNEIASILGLPIGYFFDQELNGTISYASQPTGTDDK